MARHKICRFETTQDPQPRVGLIVDDSDLFDLTAAGINGLTRLLEGPNPDDVLRTLARAGLPRLALSAVRLRAPVEQQEIWAAGVTYLRSKKARMEESDFSATAYDRVYDAPRPELFFKSMPGKVAGPGEAVGIRADARWNVPEPELALVLSSRGAIVGLTIGNDMSSRDIEGENLLYLPQAKIYTRSCALGPAIVVGADEAEARAWTIDVSIQRAGKAVFDGHTSVGQIKRSFAELAGYLCRSQQFPHGAVLLTGTGVVPPDGFTLAVDDEVRIAVSGIGTLVNRVIEV
jgi:2-dehydro-3-deoxy-D-arabinonate dehydratase